MILHERGRLRVFRCLHTVYNLVEKTTCTISEPSKRFQHKGFELAVLAYEGLRVLVYFVFLSVFAGSARRYWISDAMVCNLTRVCYRNIDTEGDQPSKVVDRHVNRSSRPRLMC